MRLLSSFTDGGALSRCPGSSSVSSSSRLSSDSMASCDSSRALYWSAMRSTLDARSLRLLLLRLWVYGRGLLL